MGPTTHPHAPCTHTQSSPTRPSLPASLPLSLALIQPYHLLPVSPSSPRLPVSPSLRLPVSPSPRLPVSPAGDWVEQERLDPAFPDPNLDLPGDVLSLCHHEPRHHHAALASASGTNPAAGNMSQRREQRVEPNRRWEDKDATRSRERVGEMNPVIISSHMMPWASIPTIK